MKGVFINSIAVIIGGIVGLLLNKGLKEKYKDVILNAVAVSVVFIGIKSAISGLMDENCNSILFIISLVIGGIIGQFLEIEERLEKFGDFLESKLPKGEKSFSKGFVSASLIFCVGTMAIIGSLNSGISGDNSILYAKSILDMITSVILASTLGIGVVFSSFSILLYQGAIALFAKSINGFLGDAVMLEISVIGGILIFILGLNMLKITKIKVGNYIISILIPILYFAFIK